MKYVVYDNTGEIRVWGESDIPDSHGLGIILESNGEGNSTHYVLDGIITPYTDAQKVTKAAMPSWPSAWSNTAFCWSDERPLLEVQDAQWDIIKAGRDAVINGGFTWNNLVFDSDPIAQARISGATTLALMAVTSGTASSFSKTWKLADNSTQELSAQDMMSVGVTLGQMVQDAIDSGEVLRLRVYACQDKDEIKGIVWPSTS